MAAGAAGIGIFFAFWSWVGFEMAPNYAEESRDPRLGPAARLFGVAAIAGAHPALNGETDLAHVKTVPVA